MRNHELGHAVAISYFNLNLVSNDFVNFIYYHGLHLSPIEDYSLKTSGSFPRSPSSC